MRFVVIAWLLVSCILVQQNQVKAQVKEDRKTSAAAGKIVKLQCLSQAELDKLFAKRVHAGPGMTLGPYSNMFFVMSKIDTDTSIGLQCKSSAVYDLPLEPAFPHSYMATLGELFDAIAMQTGCRWSYKPEDQTMTWGGAGAPPAGPAPKGVAMITFEPEPKDQADKGFPYEITPAYGWKAEPRTNWIMYVPPTAPMAMDLHVQGKLSASDKSAEAKLFASAPLDAALDRLKDKNPSATAKDLTKTKVGDYDAYFFETTIAAKDGSKIMWRQWHFMVGNQLCYVISTIFKSQDARLYPDVQSMIKTFRVKAKH